MHYTAMRSADAALARLCDPEIEVSAHYLIGETGDVLQLVHENLRAWHAGAGGWGACSDVNSRSIGIELANDGHSPFGAAQMDALQALLVDVMARWSIPPERVIGHSDMAPARKTDPGRRFDWRRLALDGQSVWPADADVEASDPIRFSDLAHRFGYPDICDFETLLAAVRLRFRPWASGPLGPGDMVAIKSLAKRFPVDPTAPSA